MSEYIYKNFYDEDIEFLVLDKPITLFKSTCTIGYLIFSGELGCIDVLHITRGYDSRLNDYFDYYEVTVFDGERYVADMGDREFNPRRISNYVRSSFYALRNYDDELGSREIE